MAAITTTGTLTAGNSRTFALAPGSALTLTLLPNCRVTVTETPETVSASDAGGNSPRTHNHQLTGVFTYGPYAMGGSVVVDNASNSGSTVTWGRKDTTVSTSSDGLSLVSGDGNVVLSFGKTDPIQRGSKGTLIGSWEGAVYSSSPPAGPAFQLRAPDENANGCANLIGNAADGVYAEMNSLSISTDVFTGLGVWVKGPVRSTDYAPDMTLLRVYLGVGGYTKQINAMITIPADGAWHFVFLTKYQFATAGGFSYGDVADRLRIRVGDASDASGAGVTRLGAGENAYIGPVYMNTRSRPKFMIRIDDGLSDVVVPNPAVDTALPDGTPAPAGGWSHELLLDHYGFKASLFLLTRRIGTSNANKTFLTWDQLNYLRAKGWACCLQTHFDPVDANNNGMRLLGSAGYADRSVASVDTAANTITASVAHAISPNPTYWGYPVLFTGTTLPAPLVTTAMYWARYVSATAFTLHPTENDAIAGTNVIDITTTGTPANYKFHYGVAAPDYTGALNDFQSGMATLAAHGFVAESKHCAVNQGSFNFEIAKAAKAAGITHVYGALYNTIGKIHLGNASPIAETTGTYPIPPQIPEMRIMGGIQTDAGGMTQEDSKTFVDACVADGGWSMNFHHALTNPNVLVLGALLARLKQQSDAGAIDVVVATDLSLT